MEAIFRHFLEYEIDEWPSVSEIVASLEANEVLLKQAGAVLEGCIRGLEIRHATVSVRQISQESPLREWFAFAVVITFQEELKKEVPQLVESLTGTTLPSEYDTLITVLVMLLAIYGVSTMFSRLFPGRDPKHLKEEYGRLINVAGDYIHVPPERIDGIIRHTVAGPKRRTTERASWRFFKPVKGRKNRGIRGPGQAEISEEAIAEIPLEALAPEIEGQKTTTEFLNDVPITLHAADKDRGAHGWAGHINGVIDDRIRMLVDKAIDPQQLFGRRTIRGDVLMVYEVTLEGEEVPKEFHLLAIRPSRRGRRTKK